jgi:NAD(P)-dependent dehydrogenase (short-subunit alcohol dehydrogenase family)
MPPVSTATFGPDSLLLTDRVAIVTGGARGIGRATALLLARLGARVAVCDKLGDELAAVAVELSGLVAGGGPAVTSEMDVRDPDKVGAFVADVVAAHGHVDVLVNNAGGGFFAPFADVSARGEAALIAENFTQVTSCIRTCVPHMEGGGSIVNVTSIEAHRAGPGFGIYSAMKAGVANLTKTLALELAAQRIRVNAVAPDMIPTPGDAELADAVTSLGGSGYGQPLPDAGSPEDVAGVIAFLASDLSRFVTGSTVHVDGGTWAAGGWTRDPNGGWHL